MKLTVLGKYGPFPPAGEGACSGYLVTAKGKNILLDCGSGVMGRLLAICPTPDIIFVSHLHYDHTSDLLPLRYFWESQGRKQPITVWTEKIESPWYDILFTHSLLSVKSAESGQSLDADGLRISFFRGMHSVPALGIRIEDGEKTFVYTGDTKYYEGMEKEFENADLVLADCAQPDGFLGGHMTISQAQKIAEGVKGKLLITHITPDKEPKIQNTVAQNIELATELKEYNI